MYFVRNRYLWIGLAMLGVFAFVLYIVVNSWLMPSYTRHGVSVAVPDVLNDSVDAAISQLETAGLRTETIVMRKPDLPRDVIVDQNPPPGSYVKPDRRVYLTVNTGDTTTVLIPRVEGLSEREAKNQMANLGLTLLPVLPDSIPSPYEGSITRQSPLPGARVTPATEVQLWVSQGLGSRRVPVPDILGMRVAEARAALLDLRLRMVVLRTSGEADDDAYVVWQSQEAGTSVWEGFQVRIRTNPTRPDSLQ